MLGRSRSLRCEPLLRSSSPQHTRTLVNLHNLRAALLVNICGVSLLRPLRLCWGESDHAVNATLALLDTEVALLTPIWIPRICDLPIFGAGLNSPADNFHSMSSCHAARDMMIDTSCVVLEVGVDSESSLNWTTSHDCLLDLVGA